MKPYIENKKNDKLIRTFKSNVLSEELVWHRDKEDRIIKIINETDWSFQLDNELPTKLNKGDKIKIPKETYHRVIKGNKDLVVEIKKINEYLTRDEISLKNYFSASEEQKKEYLPYEYYWFFDDFLIEEDIDFEKPKNVYINSDDEEIGEEYDDSELIDVLNSDYKEIYNKFAEYLYEKITSNTLPISDAEYPAWSFFDSDPELVKNQWLIHFTEDAESISNEGFKYGVDEFDKLGLTTHLGEFEKKYGGFNFAYTLNDFRRYGRTGNYSNRRKGYKYGSEAVIFRASGIKLFHYGDSEPQVIFYGNTATNITPILDGENEKWGIYSSKNGQLLYEEDSLEKIVDWFVKNYPQYRKHLKEDNMKENKKEDNPCWDGYEMIGMKEKNGKEVPNCVPKNNEEVIKRKIYKESIWNSKKLKLII